MNWDHQIATMWERIKTRARFTVWQERWCRDWLGLACAEKADK